MMDFKGRAKWDAWNTKKGLTKNQAMSDYVAIVEEITGEKFKIEKNETPRTTSKTTAATP